MAYDFTRPLMDASTLPMFQARDAVEAQLYGKTVRAAEMTNAEYSKRHRELASSRNMKAPPSHHRIFMGDLVVRKCGTKDEYETWMPDHVFDELYAPVIGT
jgi:hypothetical protein